jgi:DNA repair ATPase RecN
MPEEVHAPEPSIIDRIAQIDFRLHEIAQSKRRLSKEMGELDSEAAQLKKEQDALETARSALRNGVTISDHALVRWMERHHGLDLEIYRREMASAALRNAIAVGARGLKTEQGTFKIQDGVVITFFTGKEERS